MGPEPFLDAMIANPDYDIIIGGRAYDPAAFIAWVAYHWLDPKHRDIINLSPEALGCLTHMGKVLECGGLCATPKTLGATAVINSDCTADITPLDPASKCIPLSVAAHTLYEKTRPDLLPGPGGTLDVTPATYTQLDDGRTVRVRGSIFHLSRLESSSYTIKLEGAKVSGFRTLMMGSFGDPILIPQIDAFLQRAKAFAEAQHASVQEAYTIGFHIYGFNDKHPEIVPSQVFVVVETLAESQSVATSLASTIRTNFAHGAYPGQKATSGNFGMGIGGTFELETGPCAEFSVYHLMSLEHGEEYAQEANKPDPNSALFRWRSITLGSGIDKSSRSRTDLVADEAFEPVVIPKLSAVPSAKQTTPHAMVEHPLVLSDIASIIRSKNAGPFEVTIDVMFEDKAVFDIVRNSKLLSKEVVAGLYGIDPSEVVWAGFFARAFKATIPRRRDGKPSCSGGYMEDDVHGSQKYAPMLTIALPARVIEKLQNLKRRSVDLLDHASDMNGHA